MLLSSILKVIAGAGLSRALSMATSVAIARTLEVADFGRFSLFYVVSIVASQVPQGIDTAYLRFARNETQQSIRDEYLAATVAWKGAYCVAIIAVGAGFVWLFPERVGTDSYSGLVLRGAIAGCLLSFSGSITVAFQEAGRFGRFSAMNNVASLAFAGALLLLFAAHKYSVDNILAAYMVVSICVGAVSAVFALRRVAWLARIRSRTSLEVFAFGKWVFGVTVAYYLFQRLDVLFVGRLLSFEEVGVYGAAVQLALSVSLFTGSVGAVLMPRAMGATRSSHSLAEYASASRGPVMAMAGAIVSLAIAAGIMVPAIYGPKFVNAIAPLRILLAGWVLNAAFLPFSYLYYGLNLPHVRFLLEGGKVVVAGIALALFVPGSGIIGAAYATTIALASDVVMSGLVLRACLRSRFRTLEAHAEVAPIARHG